ncbi:MAG: response regulator transcription factor [Anaerolineae bacterium]|nr:response regulator transcription factor [Anaerolineae bacterium]
MTTFPLSSPPNIKVLVVDDSLIVREHLVTILNEITGTEIVGQAGTVAEAIGAIQKLRPNVVILDIRMPGGSGIDVLKWVKQAEVRPIVIILTNYPYPGYRQRCLRAGADFFLDKSTEFDQIPHLFELFRQQQS